MFKDGAPHGTAGGGDFAVEGWGIGVGFQRLCDNGVDDARYFAGCPALKPGGVDGEELRCACDADVCVVEQGEDEVCNGMWVAEGGVIIDEEEDGCGRLLHALIARTPVWAHPTHDGYFGGGVCLLLDAGE